MSDTIRTRWSASEPSSAVPQRELGRGLEEVGQNFELAQQSEPIAAYLTLASVFLGATTLTLHWLRRRKRTFTDPTLLDVALLALGTARLSRLITRDKVMRPLRAPFTASEHGPAGELKERAAGSGMVRAVGELVTCPRCIAIWSASALSLTYFASPASGRFIGVVLTSSLISDLTNRCIALLDDVGTPRAPA